jgi:uroporphyrinogen decarboxylase
MKPRERALRALDLEEPDRVPMFELEFQYPEEIVNEGYVLEGDQTGWTMTVFRDMLKQDQEMIERGRGLDVTEHNTRILAETCIKLGYDVIRPVFVTDQTKAIRLLKKIAPDYLVAGSANGGTVGIPDGKNMASTVHQIYVQSGELKKKLDEDVRVVIESIKKQADAGADLVISCTDYCLKEGPFYRPWVYKELIFPYLKMMVDAAHKKHIFFIQHTDGNLWPIIDDLVATEIDGLHSVDPSAGMRLAEVKARYGDRIALCGNVDAATTMVSGNPEQVAKEARQCIRDAAAGGGYFLTTSNCIYKAIPLENTLALAESGKKYGRYLRKDRSR